MKILHKITQNVLVTITGNTFYGANLRDADLRDANLHDADLHGARGLINGGGDQRGYQFIGYNFKDVTYITAGCRNFTLKEAKTHWKTRHSGVLHIDCYQRVLLIAKIAEAMGWK